MERGLGATNFTMIMGDGGTESFLTPMTNSAMFLRLLIPPVAVLPPSNLQQVPSGTTNAIGLTWNASTSPGVTGYEVLYADTNSMTTNSISLGLVTSTVISGLTSGDTYFVSVITLSPNGQSNPSAATIQAQVSNNSGGVVWSDEFNSAPRSIQAHGLMMLATKVGAMANWNMTPPNTGIPTLRTEVL